MSKDRIYLLIDQDLRDTEIYIETLMVRANVELEMFLNSKPKVYMHFVRNQIDQ